jgi:hypothetical protein
MNKILKLKERFIQKKSEFKKVFIENASESTVHSVRQIFTRNSIILRAFWIFGFLGFSAICSMLISKSFISYFQYETVTKIETVYEVPTLFPTVTFCNLNPFTTNESFQYVQDFLKKNNFNDLDQILSQNFSDLIRAFRYGVGISLRSLDITDDYRKRMGLLIDEMLLKCVYNNQPCSENDFVWYYDSLYGLDI